MLVCSTASNEQSDHARPLLPGADRASLRVAVWLVRRQRIGAPDHASGRGRRSHGCGSLGRLPGHSDSGVKHAADRRITTSSNAGPLQPGPGSEKVLPLPVRPGERREQVRVPLQSTPSARSVAGRRGKANRPKYQHAHASPSALPRAARRPNSGAPANAQLDRGSGRRGCAGRRPRPRWRTRREKS